MAKLDLSEFTKMESQIEKEKAAIARAEQERVARAAAKKQAMEDREKDTSTIVQHVAEQAEPKCRLSACKLRVGEIFYPP